MSSMVTLLMIALAMISAWLSNDRLPTNRHSHTQSTSIRTCSAITGVWPVVAHEPEYGERVG